MAPVQTDIGRALRLMALWRLVAALVVVYFVVACLGALCVAGLWQVARGPVPTPLPTPLLP